MIRFYNGEILRFGGGAHIGQGELWTEGDRIRRRYSKRW